ncbi:MAG: uroporphyrinogen decarboxylase family protein [Planctomycetota bacterium]
MNSREKIRNILSLKNSGSVGTWIGHPDPATVDIYTKALGLKNRDELYEYFDDDCRWVCAEWFTYTHPEDENKPIWDVYGGKEPKSLGEPGVFAGFTTLQEVENFDWPDPGHFDFTITMENIAKQSHKSVFSGLWCCFFQTLHAMFGMENYFIKTYTHPEVIEATTERMVDFYFQANETFLELAGDSFDTYFMGNDFGSQLDTLISLDMFKKFVLPGFKKLIDQAKKHNKKVLLHSCGAIDKAIPLIIDAGVDAIHPIQAKAAGMDAVSLAKKYKDKIAFVGGVDTQDLLVNASAAEVKDEVKRLIEVLGPNYIVSPSHEWLLPNVPLANVEAMFEAVRE